MISFETGIRLFFALRSGRPHMGRRHVDSAVKVPHSNRLMMGFTLFFVLSDRK